MVRALAFVLVAIGCGLGALYLVRAALVEVGGFTLGSPTAPRQLRCLCGRPRFWAGAALLLLMLLVSLDLYGSEELSQVVPLYSLSYVLIALIGQLFLGERVTVRRWIGILTIVTGVVLLLES
jgi:drug/metabolite transporter (DMT)-like permease